MVLPGPEDICTGDLVRVELDADIFKAMQEGHGGWSDPMLEVSRGDLSTDVQVRTPRLHVTIGLFKRTKFAHLSNVFATQSKPVTYHWIL